MIAKRIDDLSGSRIERLKVIINGKQQTAVGAILALPIIDASVAAGPISASFAPGFGIDGHKRSALREQIHYVADHNGIENVRILISSWKAPRHLQFIDIR